MKNKEMMFEGLNVKDFEEVVEKDTTISVSELMKDIDSQRLTCGSFLQQKVIEKITKEKTEGKSEEEAKKVKFSIQEYMKSQRKYVYEKEPWRIGALVFSILWKFSIGEVVIYRQKKSSNYNKTLDGQQRLTSLWLIVNNVISLDMSKAKTILPFIRVNEKEYWCEDLHGKYFNELDEELQSAIIRYPIKVTEYYNCSEAMAEMLFVLKNSGVKTLSASEVRKAAIGSNTRDFLNELTKSDWMAHTKVTDNQKEEILSQFITIHEKGIETELSKENIDNVLYQYKFGMPETVKENLIDINNYLNEVFAIVIERKKEHDKNTTAKGKKIKNYNTYQFPCLDKTNTTSLLYSAYLAINRGKSAESFANWVINFFNNPSEEYKQGRNGKAIEKDNVIARMTAIEKEISKLTESINAEDYVKQEIKGTEEEATPTKEKPYTNPELSFEDCLDLADKEIEEQNAQEASA